jgi:hypothetical protein
MRKRAAAAGGRRPWGALGKVDCMKKKTRTRSYASLGVAMTFALGLAAAPAPAGADTISKTGMAGPYSVNLKVLPAESFTGPKAEMVRDSGARVCRETGPEHPNHHLVAFVKKDGKAVEDADVGISYRTAATSPGAWSSLPVVRMHVAGKELDTTHYGNNVYLPAGAYQVRVTVDGAGPADFRVSLH